MGMGVQNHVKYFQRRKLMSDGGKGSKQRPTDRQKFEENFERIFGKGKVKDGESKTKSNGK